MLGRKPIIFTVHGFGKNLSHEFDPLAKYLKKRRYEVIQFDMFSVEDSDVNYLDWIKKAEQELQIQLKKKRPIVIIGFSMGGVIASYLASIYRVQSLILCAPAFQYFDIPNMTAQGIKMIKNSSGKQSSSSLSKNHYIAFTEVVSHYKSSIQHVDCPVYFIHGTSDDVIPVDSSRNAYRLVQGQKRMILLEDARHKFLYDGQMEQTAFVLIEEMIKGNIK
ncbi:MAG: alpha/beta fold hydrolase [Erysipelotrichaceae bacterium]|uniref:alpha/beta hydrolase n=1 Tax=Floccifex sp. TaxID=2815810 RepID=UPI002A7569B4|nr:alpha/beta fold hydrolase [Floccifex sp.]MDD7281529.1 alpha/beta fold hydrolase [Erysipelotrichaceae bacterium]MDY2957967.1 alpha/beta fold hydrolase [Floccifex sp.]